MKCGPATWFTTKMSNFGLDANGIFKRLSDGRVLRLNKQLVNTILSLPKIQESLGLEDGWYYESYEAALCDLVEWEPGRTTACVLCESERGGDDPPGPWICHRPSHRRRIPIYDARDRRRPLGYLRYVRR